MAVTAKRLLALTLCLLLALGALPALAADLSINNQSAWTNAISKAKGWSGTQSIVLGASVEGALTVPAGVDSLHIEGNGNVLSGRIVLQGETSVTLSNLKLFVPTGGGTAVAFKQGGSLRTSGNVEIKGGDSTGNAAGIGVSCAGPFTLQADGATSITGGDATGTSGRGAHAISSGAITIAVPKGGSLRLIAGLGASSRGVSALHADGDIDLQCGGTFSATGGDAGKRGTYEELYGGSAISLTNNNVITLRAHSGNRPTGIALTSGEGLLGAEMLIRNSGGSPCANDTTQIGFAGASTTSAPFRYPANYQEPTGALTQVSADPAKLHYTGGDVTITVDFPQMQFVKLLRDGQEVAREHYSTAAYGSKTRITISSAYLKSFTAETTRFEAYSEKAIALFTLTKTLVEGSGTGGSTAADGTLTLLRNSTLYSDPTGSVNDRIGNIKKGATYALQGFTADGRYAIVRADDADAYILATHIRVSFAATPGKTTGAVRAYLAKTPRAKKGSLWYAKAGMRLSIVGRDGANWLITHKGNTYVIAAGKVALDAA